MVFQLEGDVDVIKDDINELRDELQVSLTASVEGFQFKGMKNER